MTRGLPVAANSRASEPPVIAFDPQEPQVLRTCSCLSAESVVSASEGDKLACRNLESGYILLQRSCVTAYSWVARECVSRVW